VADIVLDTHAVPGDAAVDLPELEHRSGPSSTLAGAFLINLVMLRVVEILLERGVEPPLLMSQNLPGADAKNEWLMARYHARVQRFGS
jgi:uncharacterized phosphosugar-binding protein